MLKNLLIVDIAPGATKKDEGQMDIREITIVTSYKAVINDQSSFSSAYDYLIDPNCNLIINVAITGFVSQKKNFLFEE